MEKCKGEMNLHACLIYLDDTIIFSAGFEEHLEKLEAVFQRLQKTQSQTLRFDVPGTHRFGTGSADRYRENCSNEILTSTHNH